MRILDAAPPLAAFSLLLLTACGAGPQGPAGAKGDPGEPGAPGDPAARVVHRATFNGSDNQDNGLVSKRALSFDKADAATALEVTYFDGFAAKAGTTACACRWTLLFNDEPCKSPGIIFGDVGSIVEQTLVTSTMYGFCEGTKSGPLAAGPMKITVSVGQEPGTNGCDCTTGFGNVTGVISAEEID